MKTVRVVSVAGVVTLIAGIFLGLTFLSRAQVQSISGSATLPDNQPDSVVQVVADSQWLPLVSLDQLPKAGTFWTVGNNGLFPVPYPCPPDDPNAIYYAVGPSGTFLVDATGGAAPQPTARQAMLGVSTATLVQAQVDTLLSLISQIQGAQANAQVAATMSASGAMSPMGAPFPGNNDNSGGTNTYFDPSYSDPNYGTNLWIANFALSSNNAVGVVSNTTADVSYEIQYVHDLTSTNWLSAGFVLGSELTNWTAMVVTNALSYTNNLFLRIRSWASSDGSGLPDWWELQYFGTTGIDPNALDPTGDGWTIWQDFEAGYSPLIFRTPPAPQGVTAQVNPNNPSQVTLTWLPAQGAVTGYTIQTASYQYITIGVTNQFVDTNYPAYTANGYGWNFPAYYMVQADYAQGGSAWSDAVFPYSVTGVPNAQALLASDGSIKFAVANIPASASELKLTRMDWSGSVSGTLAGTTNFLVLASSFTNGPYTLPTSMTGLGSHHSDWFVQTVWSTNNESAANWAGSFAPLSGDLNYNTYYCNLPGFFCDGRTQLVQNVTFLLRSASLTGPVSYDVNGVSVSQPTNYAYASYYSAGYNNNNILNDVGDGSWPDLNRPFDENYRYRNCLYVSNTNLDTSGFLNTGYSATGGGSFSLSQNCVFQFQPPTNSTTIPPLDQSTWMQPYADYQSLGIYVNGSGQFVLPNNISNWFGLHLSSVLLAHNHGGTLYLDTLNANGTWPQTNDTYYFYPQFDQPQLQTVGYYFGRSDNPYNNGFEILGDPMPGDNDFSPTNAQPLMIAAVGQLFQAAAFAKQVVQNGDTTKPVYVAQYFDKAYNVDTNGNVTTNQTGILSPYGTFFPTEPGPTALVTMPDINTGQRGTGIVQVVSLQLDANHDGNMDLSYFGQDYVPAYRPGTEGLYITFPQSYKFWVNSGYDKPGTGGNLDKDLPVPPNPMNYSLEKITCQRDLENFARLWVCGLPKLPATSGYAITLSISGSSAINLYAAYSPDGGIEYLTDTNAATAQIVDVTGPPLTAYGIKLATLNSYQSYTLPVGSDGTPDFTYFLFEGAGIGDGQLTLTISQNGSIIIQTSAYIDLHDIKDFYERASITNIISGPSTNWSGAIERVQPAISSALGNNTNLIVLVHGFFVEDWDWLDNSDTVFKRLYWAGYQGQFATVKWPCQTGNPLLFDLSELDAYKASAGLTTYLNQLRSRFPGYRLNILAHSQGNALVSEAIENQGLQFDTYILTQGAMPASCYNANAPTNTTLLNAELGHPTPDWQPMGYHGVYTNLPGNIVDFFNTNDFLLTSGTIGGVPVNWESDQWLKPDSPYGSDGTNVWEYVTGAPNMPITDSEVSRAFVARSRTWAIGAQAPVSGQTNEGVIRFTVDLKAQFGFGNTLSEHSAQWTRPIQTSRPYYQQVLRSCLIQPAP
jgi:hypothetical protein